MTFRVFISVVSTAVLLTLDQGRAAESDQVAAVAARAKQVRARIDFLFAHRDEPSTPFRPIDDPFRTSTDDSHASSDTTLGSGPGSPNGFKYPASDETLLKQAVDTLKIGGIFLTADGQYHISINQSTYVEGGIITARVDGVAVYVRVLHITTTSVTFGLNDARITQPF